MSDRPTDLDALELTFKALAHASRRQILLVLRFRGGRMSAGEIAGRFECSWPTTTRHLKQLVEAGLIRVQREGRSRFYELDVERLRSAREWMAWLDTDIPLDADAVPKGEPR